MHEHADDRNGQIGWELQKQTSDRVTGIVTLHSRAIRNNIGHAHAILRLASFRQTSVALFEYFCTSTTGIFLPLGRKCVHQRYLIDSSVTGLAASTAFFSKTKSRPVFERSLLLLLDNLWAQSAIQTMVRTWNAKSYTLK